MRRTIIEHHVREVSSLDGLWTMQPSDGSGMSYQTYVPGVWERIPALAKFRGVADYERQVLVSKPEHYLLRIGAVSHTGIVYWDGKQVGQHYNAYTGFDILLPNVTEGLHHLRVQVDNRFSEASALHISNDYFTYGGITRPVEWQRVGQICIECIAFHSIKQEDGSYTAVVKVYVHAVEDTHHCAAGAQHAA